MANASAIYDLTGSRDSTAMHRVP